MNILKYLFGCPYENYQPTQKMPPITFSPKVKRERSKKIAVQDLPENVKQVQGTQFMRHEKIQEKSDGFEIELWHRKDPILQDAEWKTIEKKYSSINRDAVIIMKKEWAKDSKIAHIEHELKKRKLKYGQTYIKYCLSVFNEYEKEIGETNKATPLPLSI